MYLPKSSLVANNLRLLSDGIVKTFEIFPSF